MKLSINFRNTQNRRDLAGYIARRLSFRFSHLRHNVEQMIVTLYDANGPKGGIDKQCQVTIKPVGLQRLVVTEKSESLRQAIDRGISRSSQNLARKLKRKRALSLRKGVTRQSPVQPFDNYATSDFIEPA